MARVFWAYDGIEMICPLDITLTGSLWASGENGDLDDRRASNRNRQFLKHLYNDFLGAIE
jgi:hypothetical protein